MFGLSEYCGASASGQVLGNSGPAQRPALRVIDDLEFIANSGLFLTIRNI
jgi:hypothetical protein